MKIMFKVVLSFLFAWIAAIASAADFSPKVPALVPAPLAGDLIQTTVHRLPNGLTIYLSPNSQSPRISAWIAVRTGSKMDPADCTGLAHYLEHMLFKGTARLGTLDYKKERPHLDRITALYEERFRAVDPAERVRLAKEIDRENQAASRYAVPNELGRLYTSLGFNGFNAFTGNEYTMYVCDFPRNRLEVWATAESERFSQPVLRLFQTELETVYEEKNRSLDNPGRGLWEAFMLALYKKHPYGTQPTLGSIEHLKNPSLKRVLDYYLAHYVPNNMALVLAGDFEREPMLETLKRHFSAWKPGLVPAAGPWPIPSLHGEETVSVTFESEEQVVIGWLTPANKTSEADALDVARMLLNNGRTGIIDAKLNQEQRVKWADAGFDARNDSGCFYLLGTPKQGQSLEEVRKLLLECVEALKGGEFTEEDLRSAITNWEIGQKRGFEDNAARVDQMAFSFAMEDEWAHTSGWLDRFRKVTRDDVLRVSRRYLGDDRVVAYRRNGKPDLPSITKPGYTKVTIDPDRQSVFARRLQALPVKPIKPQWLRAGEDYVVSDHPFGRLWTGRNPMNDVFTLNIGITSVGTGTERELGAAFDLLNLSGAGSLKAREFKRKLCALGTSLEIGADERWAYVGLSGLEANLEASLQLLKELFWSPNVEPGTLEKMKVIAIGAHQDAKKDPELVYQALREFALRGMGSNSLQQLNDAEVRGLEQGRLLSIARNVWQYPADVRYVGTRSNGEIARMYASVFPAPTRGRETAKRIGFLRPAGSRVIFTHRDMVQSRIGMFAADGVLDPASQIDYDIYSAYMGGSMSAVYFQEIREARSLAYSAGGGYIQGHWAGDDNRVSAGLSTQADKTVEGATLAAGLLRNPPLSGKRFAAAKQAVVERYRTNPEHFRGIPDAVLRWEEQGILHGDPGPAVFVRAQAYTLKDFERFATRFKEAPLTFTILGNRDRVNLEQLKGLGKVEEVSVDSLFPY